MTRNRRKILLAAIVSLVGATAAIPVIVSGTASAQEGSRICGLKYHSTDSTIAVQEEVFRIYDVPKADNVACDTAMIGGRPASASGFPLISEKWSGGEEISGITCENFTKDYLKGAKIKDDGARLYDQIDICNNMERSDTAFQMKAYFLYKRSNEQEWHFKHK